MSTRNLPARLLLAPDRRRRLNDEIYLFARNSHTLDSSRATAQIGPTAGRGSARSKARGQLKWPHCFSIYSQLYIVRPGRRTTRPLIPKINNGDVDGENSMCPLR